MLESGVENGSSYTYDYAVDWMTCLLTNTCFRSIFDQELMSGP